MAGKWTRGSPLPRDAIANVLAGSPATFDSEGLRTPVEAKFLTNLAHVGSGMMAGKLGAQIAQALARQAIPALQGLGEAGAIFPEGAPLPAGNPSALKELGQILPDSQRQYKLAEQLANWHAGNMDFPAVLRDKWMLLKNAGGN